MNFKTKQINKIKTVFGFNDIWAERFVSLNAKLSIWIADSFLEDLISNNDNEFLHKTDIITKGDISSLSTKDMPKKPLVQYLNVRSNLFWEDYRVRFQYILDWVLSPRRGANVNVVKMTFVEALSGSTIWHTSLEEEAFINYEETNEIFIDLRDIDGFGFYWANLNTDYSDEESRRMGHCGRDSGTILFSLRSVNNLGESKSHVTASYSKQNCKLNQIKGRKNTKPKPAYHGYICTLLTNEKYPIHSLSNNTFNSSLNFKLEDLNEDARNNVFKKNRDLHVSFVFGDKEQRAVHYLNDTHALLTDVNNKNNAYGVVCLDTLDILVPFEYYVNVLSEYTDFLLDEENVVFNVMVHIVSSKNSNGKIIIISSNKKFAFINQSMANEILKMKTSDEIWTLIRNSPTLS